MMKYIVFIVAFLFPLKLFYPSHPPHLIVWYVGQGQMVTYSDLTHCVHFDMGGEHFPIKKLLQECRHKKNQVFFSHWDWDHINFARKAWRRIRFFCRLNWPGGRGTQKKKQFLAMVPECQKRTQVFREIPFPAFRNQHKQASRSNKFSRVVVVKNQVLIPGDSPGSSESLWQHKIPNSIRILILGHHGSRYSTYPALLNRLPGVTTAVASARRKRYGHPHPLLKKRLHRYQIPLLSTEDFNHIHIPLP